MSTSADLARRHKNWKRVRYGILVRAKGRCENCRLRNQSYVLRCNSSDLFTPDDESAEALMFKRLYPNHRRVKVSLEIIRADEDPENNAPENLLALCQKCHSIYSGK